MSSRRDPSRSSRALVLTVRDEETIRSPQRLLINCEILTLHLVKALRLYRVGNKGLELTA
jgi:hypothetical protein